MFYHRHISNKWGDAHKNHLLIINNIFFFSGWANHFKVVLSYWYNTHRWQAIKWNAPRKNCGCSIEMSKWEKWTTTRWEKNVSLSRSPRSIALPTPSFYHLFSSPFFLILVLLGRKYSYVCSEVCFEPGCVYFCQMWILNVHIKKEIFEWKSLSCI